MLEKNTMNPSDDFESLKISVASPEKIVEWSHGEVSEAETINYRTQKPEKGGLFCEAIFGPIKDYQCSCGKYRGIRFNGIKCDRCGVVITHSSVRRFWTGHISLCIPICHIWYLKTPPHILEAVLGVSSLALEQVIYYNAYIITKINENELINIKNDINKEYKIELKNADNNQKSDINLKYKQALKELDIIHVKKVLNEKEYYYLTKKFSNAFEAETGSEPIVNFLHTLDLQKEINDLQSKINKAPYSQKERLLKRLKILKSFWTSKTQPEWMFITNLPILPPDLRPMVPLDGGRYASSDLNDLYRRIITRNNRLKKLMSSNAPFVIVKNEKRMLQESVDMLFDNSLHQGRQTSQRSQRRPLRSLADILKGKQGRFRQNLLGKRVDYSGRSAIVVGPTLKLNECGVPKEMALEIFRPFIIHKLLAKDLAHSIPAANKLIDEKNDEVWAILEEVTKDKYILLNRAPTLHRLSIQAFHPILIEGLAIQIHPMVCEPFGADFDGDTMSLHLPLSEEAQKECDDIMVSTRGLLKPSSGETTMSPTKDIVLGCYWLTLDFDNKLGENKIFLNAQEAMLAYDNQKIDLHAKIKIKYPKNQITSDAQIIETTVGRLIFNELLPNDFPYQNEVFTNKKLKKLINSIIKQYGFQIAANCLDNIKTIGFKYATVSGLTWNLADLKSPADKQEIIKKHISINKEIQKQFDEGLLSQEERYTKVIENYTDAMNNVKNVIIQNLAKEVSNPIKIIIDSGARGTPEQLNQMVGIKGIVTTPNGRGIELPVLSSYKEGFNCLEYFIATHGSRKGLVDTAIKTSQSGYLTRKLVDVEQDMIIYNHDCQDTEGLEILRTTHEELEQSFASRIVSRVLAKNVKLKNGKIIPKNTLIDSEIAKEIVENSDVESIWAFSPLTCKNIQGVCQKCYGADLTNGNLIKIGEAVGIIAAQAIGEPGTQLTLRSFHAGGIMTASDITLGLPYIDGLFECRNPKNEALLCEVEGIVDDILTPYNEFNKIVIKITTKCKNPTYKKYSRSKQNKQFLEPGEKFIYSVNPNKNIKVVPNQQVKIGDPLTIGSINLKQLFPLVGLVPTENYIKKEAQKIYLLAATEIHEKYFELVIRKMFSQVFITNSGDSSFIPGEVVSLANFIETNYNLRNKHKKPATANRLIRGIKKVALNSDSFLSAVSFEETSHALIKSAIEGKEDKLNGLKANIIIGRLIPAGTGFRKFNKQNNKQNNKK